MLDAFYFPKTGKIRIAVLIRLKKYIHNTHATPRGNPISEGQRDPRPPCSLDTSSKGKAVSASAKPAMSRLN